VQTLASRELPSGWRSEDALAETRKSAGVRMAEAISFALIVPSLPIRGESNVRVNPLHTRIAKLRIDSPRLFGFDARVLRAETKQACIRSAPTGPSPPPMRKLKNSVSDRWGGNRPTPRSFLAEEYRKDPDCR